MSSELKVSWVYIALTICLNRVNEDHPNFAINTFVAGERHYFKDPAWKECFRDPATFCYKWFPANFVFQELEFIFYQLFSFW